MRELTEHDLQHLGWQVFHSIDKGFEGAILNSETGEHVASASFGKPDKLDAMEEAQSVASDLRQGKPLPVNWRWAD